MQQVTVVKQASAECSGKLTFPHRYVYIRLSHTYKLYRQNHLSKPDYCHRYLYYSRAYIAIPHVSALDEGRAQGTFKHRNYAVQLDM